MLHSHCATAIFCSLVLITAQARAQFPATISSAAALNANAAGDSNDDFSPQMATDGKGHWVAVWAVNEPGPGGLFFGDILVARSTDNGATWTPPVPLDNKAAVDSRSDDVPQITTDGNGIWIAVWSSNGFSGSDFDILVSRSTDNGATWTASVGLNTNAGSDTGNDEYPQIATDGQGHWAAVWQSDENLGGSIGTDNDIFVARSTDNGATWTPPAPLNNNAANDGNASDEDTHIATDGQGTWLAVWVAFKFSGNDDDILFARSTDNGATWTTPEALNTTAASDTGGDKAPRIATDRHGVWLAVWASDEGATGGPGFDNILSARSTDNGATWTNPAPVNNDATTNLGSDFYPCVATDRTGNWVVAWVRNIGNVDFRNFVAYSADDGMNWTDPTLLNANGVTGENDPQIATDGRGNWIAAWDAFVGNDSDIFTERFALPDCNHNGVGDGQDIAEGVSADCDNNHVPDECDLDSDADGVIDPCDNCPSIANTDQADANGNSVGDACDAPQPAAGCGTCAQGAMPATLLTLSLMAWGRWRKTYRKDDIQ